MSREPCYCGAIDCRVCGPMQGYRKPYDQDEEDTLLSWMCQQDDEDDEDREPF